MMRVSAFRMACDGPGEDFLIQPLFIEHHVRLDDAAALGAAGHTGAVGDEVHIIERAAARAVVAQGAAVELKHVFGSRRLVQAVDVLGDDRFQLALFFQPGQPQVGRVGLCALYNQLIPVKTVKLLGVLLPEGVAQDRPRAGNHISGGRARPHCGNPGCRSRWKHPHRQRKTMLLALRQ